MIFRLLWLVLKLVERPL